MVGFTLGLLMGIPLTALLVVVLGDLAVARAERRLQQEDER